MQLARSSTCRGGPPQHQGRQGATCKAPVLCRAVAAPAAAAATRVAPAQALRQPVVRLIDPATEDDLHAVLQEQQLRRQWAAGAGTSASAAAPAAAAAQRQQPQVAAKGGLMGGLARMFRPQDGTQPAQQGQQQDAAADMQRPMAVVAMFTASWCGPCSLVYRELVRLPSLHRDTGTDLVLLVLDVDQNAALASRLAISSLPTLLFLGPDPAKPPMACSQGFVSHQLIADIATTKAVAYAGCNLAAKPLRL